ncbi:MAG TPA: ABC transporter ATP-binding protein [Aggregatilineales bacterium]|nr:ABC transporter ATP-binding protein [Aggregatilineales bacterium]
MGLSGRGAAGGGGARALEQEQGGERVKLTDSDLLWMLARFIRPYWLQLGVVFFLLILVTMLSLLPPYLTQLAVDGPLQTGDQDQLISLALIFFATIPATFALQFGYIYLLQTVGQNALMNLRQVLFEHILRQDMRYFNRTPVGQIVSRFSNDIDALTELFSTSIVMVASNLVTLMGLIAVMLALNWRLALISLSVLPVMALITAFFRSRIREASSDVHRSVAEFLAYINEQFNGMLIVQLFGRQQDSREGFDRLNSEYRSIHMVLRDQYTWFSSSLQLLTSVGLAVVLYGGGQGLLAEWATLGMVIAFIQYTRRSFTPILLLSEQFSQIQTALSAGERIARTLRVEPEIVEPEVTQDVADGPLTAHFDHIEFGYEAGNPVIRGIDLEIPAGKTYAIVGATGAGKTSLAGLLARFYDVNDGAVRINGVDVRHLSLTRLRQLVTVVPQSPYCFNGTVADNLRLFDDSITDEDMRRAAETARAAPFIERLSGGYDHVLLPGGGDLSQGQRQLLALARALLHNPQSILVLDEATSSIDTETEHLIQEGLHNVLKGRTSIIIAHRLSTVRDADQIIVLRRGRIIEQGSHDDLLRSEGAYARLYNSQFAESTGESK